MSSRWRIDWVRVFLWATLGMAVLVFFNMARDFDQPFGGYMAVRSSAGQSQWYFDPITPKWWAGRRQGQLQPGDELVALGDHPYGPYQRQVFNQAVATSPQITLTVKRHNESVSAPTTITRFSVLDWLDVRLPDLIMFAGFWLLAYLIFHAQPTETFNRVATVAFCAVGGMCFFHLVSLFQDNHPFTLILWWLDIFIVLPLTGPSIIYLALYYPIPSRWLYRPGVVPAIYTAAFLASATRVGEHIVAAVTGSPTPPISFLGASLAVHLFYIFLAGGSLLIIVRTIWLTFNPWLSRRVRAEARLFLYATLFALPSLASTWLDFSTNGKLPHLFDWPDLRYGLLFAPLLIAFSILRYRTFQSRNSLITVVFVLTLSAVCASVGDTLLHWWLWPTELHHSAFAILFVIVAVAIGIMRVLIAPTGLLARYFHWAERNYAAAQKFGEHVLRPANHASLPQQIVQNAMWDLEVEHAALWLWEPNTQCCQLAAYAARHHPVAPPSSLCLTPAEKPLALEIWRTTAPTLPAWLQPLGAQTAFKVVAPLCAEQQFIGVLSLGQRQDEDIFDERDLNIVQLVAQQAAFFLLTDQQQALLRQMPQREAEAQEQQRRQIAQELHDSVQQILGRLPFYLDLSLQAIRVKPDKAEANLKYCIDEVTQASQVVRQISHNLAPHGLESSLAQPLNDLVSRVRRHTDLEVVLELAPELDQKFTQVKARHALYRVLQQALDNVISHAQARQVRIRLTLANNFLHFVVHDNGRGFGQAEQADALARGSFGLTTMTDRITRLGGELKVISAPAQGTHVVGRLPLTTTTTEVPQPISAQ